MEFTRFGRKSSLLKINFTGKSLEVFKDLQKGHWFAQKTLELLPGLQRGPWGMAGCSEYGLIWH
jgi:hypothetical protein